MRSTGKEGGNIWLCAALQTQIQTQIKTQIQAQIKTQKIQIQTQIHEKAVL